MRHCSVALFVLALGSVAVAQPDRAIVVKIANLKTASGQIRCALFVNAEGFPKQPERATVRGVGRITDTTAECRFENVAPGRIAITAFHDENANGRMDLRLGLIPEEGIGLSRNPRVSLRAPKFEEAAFSYEGGPQTIAITLNQRCHQDTGIGDDRPCN